MATERSDKLHSDWRASTEKFDYFVLGVVGALCAFVGQSYKPGRLGFNPAALELIALLVLVFSVVAGFRRIEQTLIITALNSRELHALEARGGMAKNMQNGSTLVNEATGQFFTPEQAIRRFEELTHIVKAVQPPLEKAKTAAWQYYRARNALALCGFLLLLAARVWSAYS
ncbi:hypothetical protein [Niveibacterium microcysteis]|uniref:Uncharacterized protein n=1 Tax=Niveibacterium microcysteis TaxID=2811415 RepID=A0ABX7MD28_9RHOO|nr:hypothetical protein [Niveibacterium microcysteis]QSI78679.1 hypothetical protein JY500_08765 [Niveibacterium microcysteis]